MIGVSTILYKKTSHLPFFRSGDLTENSTKEPGYPKREIQRVSLSANPDADDRLDSWKEIASHLKRTVRTVQRWEKHERLPVHRHLHQRVNSVYARKSEIDEWWSREAHSAEIKLPEVPSKRSRQEVTSPRIFTMSHSERGCRESRQTPPEWLVECVLKLREVEICSPDYGTGHVVSVLRVRIRIREYLRQPGTCRTTKDAKSSSRSLSLAASGRLRQLLPGGWGGDALVEDEAAPEQGK